MPERPERRNVLLGISGSIAAYKAAELARLLVSRGYAVRVVLTEAAQRFVTATTLESLSGNHVVTSLWEQEGDGEIGHIELADWADVFAIVPATANTIAKLAAGLADDPLSAMALATRAPLLIAPAMNTNMYEHAQTQRNMQQLYERGVKFVEPEAGDLACGWVGNGRLASPWEVFYHIRRCLSFPDLDGKKVLIATGPTREPLDPVRFITNRSSGKMGVALAREAFCRGAEVVMVHGPVLSRLPNEVACIGVETAVQMHEAVMREVREAERPPDVVIMAAAVADFRPREQAEHKMKKSKGMDAIAVVPNPDILAELGEFKGESERPILVGFAVETGEIDDLLAELRDKLVRKNADIMVGNFAADAFDLDTNSVWILARGDKLSEVSTTYKSRVAAKILDVVNKY